MIKYMFETAVRILGQLFFYNYIENIESELVLTVFIFNEMPAIRGGDGYENSGYRHSSDMEP